VKRSIYIILAVLAIIGMLAAIGCSSETTTPTTTPTKTATPTTTASKAPIPIAVIAVQSGPSEPLGEQEFLGARVAVEQINNAGGVLGGRMLELHEYDEGYSTDISTGSFQQAKAAGVKFIVGPHEASGGYAVIPLAKANNIIYWDCIAGTDAATVPGYYRGLFNSPTQTKQAALAFCGWIADAGYKKVGVLGLNVDYGQISQGWADYYMAQHPTSWKLAARTWYTWGQTDVTAEVNTIVAANPDFIWLYVYSGAQAIPAVQRIRELGYTGAIATDWASLDDGQIAAEGGSLLEGVYSYTGWMPDPAIPEAMALYNRYEDYCQRHGITRVPGDYAVSSYSGVIAYAKAIELAGTADDNSKVIDAIYALANTTYITPRGIQFEIMPGGLELDPGEYIQQIKNSKVVIYDWFPLTRADFGEPYVPPGFKTLLELEQEGGH
jgi:branched-chain amino acid transport system substrate-binding protein